MILPAYSVVLFIFFASVGDCLNILAVFPHAGRSHFDVFKPMLSELTKRGNHLTVISHHKDGAREKNWRDITLDGEVKTHIVQMDMVQGRHYEKYFGPVMLARFAHDTDNIALNTKELHSFLKENNTFDVILMEYFNSYSFMGIAKKYKVPVIALSSCLMMPWSYRWFADTDIPSYVPNHFLAHSNTMNFLQRVENLLAHYYQDLIYYYGIEYPTNQKSIKHFGENILENYPIMYDTSLMLVNNHFTLNLPKEHSPNVIEVGGIHVGKPKQLPADIEKWVNESSQGVIYFSLGSLIKGHTLPDEKRQAFLGAFARFPQRVLWKWENESMPDQPKNVLIKKWMPQLDILCHPNVKAFVSHGGLLGTTEAVHCGVPVVVMPQFGDQFSNAESLQKSGGGVVLNLASATEQSIYDALKKVLEPSFKKQAEELSARFKDRPLSPMETAIYWIEYVVRHKGAHHMKTAAVGMPFYKYYLLDVFAFLGVIVLLYSYISFVSMRWMFRKLFSSKASKIKTN